MPLFPAGGSGLPPWNSAQTLFDGANLYYSDGTTFVDSAGNVTLTAGTIDGMVIGGSAPEAGTFSEVITGNISSSAFLSISAGAAVLFPSNNVIQGEISFSNGSVIQGVSPTGVSISGSIFCPNQSSPTTPTGGSLLYSLSGQPQTLDVNGVNINISLCPQPDTGWTANSDAGHKAIAIASSMTREAYQLALNILVAGAGDDIYTIGEKLKALEAALSSNPSLYPNA